MIFRWGFQIAVSGKIPNNGWKCTAVPHLVSSSASTKLNSIDTSIVSYGDSSVSNSLLRGGGVNTASFSTLSSLPSLLSDLSFTPSHGYYAPNYCDTPWTGLGCNDGLIIYIDLSGRGITGQLPTWIFSLTSVVYLSLGTNYFKGTLPTLIGNLIHLETLDLSWNQFSGTLPSTLGLLSKLQVLKISNNHFNQTIPVELHQITTLSTMSMEANMFSGQIPCDIVSMENTSIDLSSNPYLSCWQTCEVEALKNDVFHKFGTLKACVPTGQY